MQLVWILISLTLALAAPQGERAKGTDAPEEMLIRLVLHVRRSKDGTQLVVDLDKSEDSSTVVRPAPKPIASFSTELPFWRSSPESPKRNDNIFEKSYEAPGSAQQRVENINAESHHRASTETVRWTSQQESQQPVVSDKKDNVRRGGTTENRYPIKEDQTVRPVTSSGEEWKNDQKHKNEYVVLNSSTKKSPSFSSPKLEFKISVGQQVAAPSTVMERFDPTRIYFPTTSTTVKSKIDYAAATVPGEDISKLRPEGIEGHNGYQTQTKPPEKFYTPSNKEYPNPYHPDAFVKPADGAPQNNSPERDNPTSKFTISPERKPFDGQQENHPISGQDSHVSIDRENIYKPDTTNIPPKSTNLPMNSTDQAAVELYDKSVADQGFGVLASRCESFAPGLVSDGAGGCTRPIVRPKNKNYQGSYMYRSAAGNELHSDVSVPEEDDTTERDRERNRYLRQN